MRYFKYKAIDSAGCVQRGSLAALSLADADSRLDARGLDPIFCKPSLSLGLSFGLVQRPLVNRKQLIDFTFHLQQMVEAGLPLIDSLKEYRDSVDQRHMQTAVAELVTRIESGSSLSIACASQPSIFKPMYTSMLEAGEQSGKLAEILADLLSLLKWQDETLSSLRKVIIYPAFVCVVLGVVIGFVMTWLVPSLTSFITAAGAELPWHTQWLIAVSDAITDYWFLVLLLLLAFALGLSAMLRSSHSVRLHWHHCLLKLPLVGQVLYKIKLARFCRCSALMYASGINLIDTLKHGEALVDNLWLTSALCSVREKIIAGESVADAFCEQPELPVLLSRLIRVGESTGGLDRAFLQTSYFYDRDSREAIERLEQFIGPALIILVGSIMMWVVVSVIGPIYDLVFSMQGAM